MKKQNTTIVERKDQVGYRVFFWEKGKRKNKNFKHKADAINFARERDAENQLPEEILVSVEERIILNRLRRFGDLNEVLKFLEANYRFVESTETFKNAFDAFIREKARTNRRPRTISDYEAFRDKLKDYHNTPMKDIGDTVADMILSTVRTDSRKQKMSACLSALFNWGIKKKFCAHNPFYQHTKSDIIRDKEHVPTFKPREAQSFLAHLPPTMKAGYAIMLFAGVRPAEIFNDDGKPVLKWEDIDFDKKTILIRADSAKTHSARILQGLPENLWQWLEMYRQSKGNVIGISAGRVSKNRREACKQAKVEFAIDICRHSFGSYGYHFLGVELTVEIMGHIGGFSTFVRHYKGVSNLKESKEYFAITPKNTPSKWVRNIPYPNSRAKNDK